MNSRPQVFDKLPKGEKLATGLLVCCGGFEDRSVSFPKKLQANGCDVERAAVIHYETQESDNKPNFERVVGLVEKAVGRKPEIIGVHAANPIASYEHIKEQVLSASNAVSVRKATIDISGMTHMWGLGVIHACILEGFEVDVVYTEAMSYFPLPKQAKPLLDAWRSRNYEVAQDFLQSGALMGVHILPDFAGNFRPGHPSCLVVFAGYEPNRLEGLVDSYAPGALVVLYGKSPRPEHAWRKKLSRQLHQEMFSNWPRRYDVCSTLRPEEATAKLEEVLSVVGVKYDVAVAPHCSKMQGVASYVFWRRHPEVQLIFTSPVRFRPDQYSQGERQIYIYHLTSAL